MSKDKLAGIITLKENMPKNIEMIIIDPNCARFSSFVILAKLAMHAGNPSPKDTPIKHKMNATLTVVAFSNIAIAKEENTPIKVHANRKRFRLISLLAREAPTDIEMTALKNNVM
jgi:hypothetical protein